ncbi:MAG TPA: anhydro-N-acetylmuramic acid kinase [Bacteroidia bacterium]|nr:anhydro-N-acetylmuramic acid kinase [Bacteroidia bacterium]
MSNVEAQQYDVIGLMSGTSLDGLDIAHCRFHTTANSWKYEILKAETIAYSPDWKQRLINAEELNALNFQHLHTEYGFYLGQRVADFIIKNNIKADFVSSHGHTIFHQPEKRLTVQIGNGSSIASKCKLPVVCDFRALDVALAGQGAPLVPVGDRHLFSEFDYCLNLGGFANVSYEHSGRRIAYDICPVNIVMNALCESLGKSYDENGALAKEGMVSHYLLNELNQLGFYKVAPNTPKSLGKEWVVNSVNPILQLYEVAENDVLRTFCEHIAFQIAKSLNDKPKGKLLITGGGAYNTFLMQCIRGQVKHEIVVPDQKTIEFKEALIFAFLGVLRIRNEINCLRSVTGAFTDSCTGAIYLYKN